MVQYIDVTVGNDPGTNAAGDTTAGTLSAAIAQLNASDPAGGPYTIRLQTDVQLSGPLSPILGSVTIDGQSHTIDAGGSTRIFFIGTDAASQTAYASSIIGQRQAVTIQNVHLDNGLAQGGAAVSGGGGGLGAGGAVFINQTADVTLSNVSLAGSKAIGGSSASSTGNTLIGGGGGGLGGNGGAGYANQQNPTNASSGGGGGLFGNGGSDGVGGGGGVFADGGSFGFSSGLGPQGGLVGSGGGGFSGSLYSGYAAGGHLSIYGMSGSGGSVNTRIHTTPGGDTGGDGAALAGGGFGGGSASFGSGNGGSGGFGGGGGQGASNNNSSGGAGGFGGGGGSGLSGGGSGGFGGGGAAGANQGGNGGFGGGGGSGSYGGNGGFGGGGGVGVKGVSGDGAYQVPGGPSGEMAFPAGGAGGFGGGRGVLVATASGTDSDPTFTDAAASGGGGSGMGGAIFVAAGGTLRISGSGTLDGIATGGANGLGTLAGAFGGGIFYQGTDGTVSTLTFDGGDQTIASAIADYVGSGGTNPNGGTDATDQGGSLGLALTGPGTVTLQAANTYTGGTTIAGGTLDLARADVITDGAVTAGAAGTGAITFAGTGDHQATLALEMSAQNIGGTFGNTLGSFGDDDALDLKGLSYDAASTTVTYDFAGHTLTVAGDGKTETFSFDGTETPGTGNTFYAHRDQSGTGTLINNVAVCYAGGTLIRTARGDIAVEAIQVGDIAVTGSGAHRPIRWIGHQTIHCGAHRVPRKVWPVRIAAHAFGPNRPVRDLCVSPGHALCVDVVGEILIPASSLVNGATIAQVAVDEVTYWHVELDSHDILLANGLPAESYRDTGNRSFFAGGSDDPDAEPKTHADFRHPFHHKGPLVEAVRAQLTARAATLGWTEDRAADLHLVVDGKVMRPFGAGDTALFLFPASARDVRLVAKTFVPADRGGVDKRRLGVRIHGLSLSGTAGAPRRVSLEDPALFDQFHASEREAARAWRWTQGDLALAPSLWSGLTGDVLLHLTYVFNTVRGYLPPAALPPALNEDKPMLYAVS